MSSSSAMQQQIAQCRRDIEICKRKIEEKSQIIQEQTGEYNSYINKTNEYQTKMTTRMDKANAVYEYAGKSMLSAKYQETMNNVLNESVWADKKQQLGDIGDNMSREIGENKDELERLQRELNSLYNRLSALQAQYEAALRREAQERAAAQEAARAAAQAAAK